MDIEGGYSGNSYSADTGGLGGVNDPFSYYDPATGGYTTGSTESPSTEGDYGAAVFNAIDKVAAGQPLSANELYALSTAGLGGMVLGDGQTVDSTLEARTQSLMAGFSFDPTGVRVGPALPTTPVDDSGVGGVSPEEFEFNDRTVDYGVPLASEGVPPVDESGPGGIAVGEERTGDYGTFTESEPSQPRSGGFFGRRSGFGRVSAPAPVAVEEVEELPEEVEAEFQSVPTYTQFSPKAQSVYVDAIVKGLPDEEAYLQALKTEAQELAFEDKIQQLAAEEYVPAPADDSGAGGVDTGDGYFGFNEDRDYGVSLESETAAPPPAPVDDSGAGGVSPEEFEFNEDRDYSYSETAAPPPPPPQVMPSQAFGRRGVFGGTRGRPPAPASAPVSDRSLTSRDRGDGEGVTGASNYPPDYLYGMEDRPAPDYSPDYLYGMEDRPVTSTTPSFGSLEETGLLGGAADRAPATGGLGSVVGRLREGDISGAFSLLKDVVSAPATPVADEQPFTGPPLPSNVVGTGTPGGMLVDERGEPVLSTSYGLPGEYTPSGPTLDPALLELAATARKMTVDELRAVIDAEIQRGAPVSTVGLDQETLEALQNAGFGGRDISPTQTVDQALASMQTNEFLTEYMPTLIGMFGPPGAGALLSGVKTINDLMQGKLSPGAALTRELIGAFARQTGLSPTALTNALEGKFGDAAANQVKSSLFNALSQEAGVQGSAIGMIANELGFLNPLTGQIDKAVTEVIPDQNFGIPGRVAAGLDQFVGPIKDAASQGLGALGDAAQTGLTGLGDFLGQIGQGVQTGVDAVTGGIGDLIDAVTGRETAPVVDESGVGGVEPSEFEFIEDRIYDTGTDVTEEQTEDYFTPVDETGPKGSDVTEERINTGLEDFTPGTGSVGLPGEELGEGILTGVDPWDQALIDADTGGVYDLDTGTDIGTVDTGVQPGGETETETETDTVVQPPPVIPTYGGGTTQPYGSYFARVPTGYQIVQGLYGPVMQYTYGNLPLGGA